MLFIAAEAIAEDTIHLTLQLNEPGTLWCSAGLPDASPSTTFCKLSEYQGEDPAEDCFFETFVKGVASKETVFRVDAHHAFQDYVIEVNRILTKDTADSTALPAQTDFEILCFAEDDWAIEAASAAVKSPNFAGPLRPNGVVINQTMQLQGMINLKTTLDQTPPLVTLGISAPSNSETSLEVVLTMDEAGILHCLPLLAGTATPHLNRVLAYNLSLECSDPIGCSRPYQGKTV